MLPVLLEQQARGRIATMWQATGRQDVLDPGSPPGMTRLFVVPGMICGARTPLSRHSRVGGNPVKQAMTT